MVFHGDISDSYEYFASKGYILPPGENIADWLIDIASGLGTSDKRASGGKLLRDSSSLIQMSFDDIEEESSIQYPRSSIKYPKSFRNSNYMRASTIQYPRSSIRNSNFMRASMVAAESFAFRKVDTEKLERRSLNLSWVKYLRSLDDQSDYLPPPAYDLPKKRAKQPFARQIATHMARNTIVFYRNLWSRLFDASTIVVATALICAINGTLDLVNYPISYVTFEDFLVEDDYRPTVSSFLGLYKYNLSSINAMELFYLTCGVIVSLLISLQAAKAIVSKRVEFLREAGSGNDVNAYFIALNITTTVEYMFQMLLVSSVVFWLRNSLTSYVVFFVNFTLLAWTSASWAFFFAGFIPPQNLSVTIGFFVSFCCLIFGGGMPPYDYEFIYSGNKNRTTMFFFASYTS